jgi:hypothetical protein
MQMVVAQQEAVAGLPMDSVLMIMIKFIATLNSNNVKILAEETAIVLTRGLLKQVSILIMGPTATVMVPVSTAKLQEEQIFLTALTVGQRMVPPTLLSQPLVLLDRDCAQALVSVMMPSTVTTMLIAKMHLTQEVAVQTQDLPNAATVKLVAAANLVVLLTPLPLVVTLMLVKILDKSTVRHPLVVVLILATKTMIALELKVLTACSTVFLRFVFHKAETRPFMVGRLCLGP